MFNGVLTQLAAEVQLRVRAFELARGHGCVVECVIIREMYYNLVGCMSLYGGTAGKRRKSSPWG